ncbi:AMIN domain-containing protein [bacterium]|nr:AMIN domain-containing protein [bacterium]MBU1993390.1 AMIN domain-containing protein [bacterium]
MTKVFYVIFFFIITLNARENPFFPSEGEMDLPYTSNESKSLQPLNRAAITLPPQARVLQNVTISYKNLDGSMQSKSIELENTVDWHLPIFISQNYSPSGVEKKVEGKKAEFEKLASIQYASFYSSEKSLKIVTKDKIIRNFLLVKPHRIVVDFQRDTNLKSYEKVNDKNIFSKIRIGNHSGYYRAVIELDGYYKYRMTKISEGYLIELK